VLTSAAGSFSSQPLQRASDLLSRLTSLTYPDTTVAAYSYNNQGGIETIDLASATSPLSH